MTSDHHPLPLLRVDGLTLASDAHTIVKELTFTLRAGEMLGIVGESGSGKSMTAYAIAGLLPREVLVTSGSIMLDSRSLLSLSHAERRMLAGRRIGMVLQDRRSSFNPVRTIGSILIESIVRHRAMPTSEARALAMQALTGVRLLDSKLIDAYPHQLSGGQLQRAMIALARLNDPVLLIADEPTTALDPIVQLQILSLLRASAVDRGVVLITHDLHVAAAVCDQLIVMHRGECIEQGPARQVIDSPEHTYTRQWLASARLLSSGAPLLRSVSAL